MRPRPWRWVQISRMLVSRHHHHHHHYHIHSPFIRPLTRCSVVHFLVIRVCGFKIRTSSLSNLSRLPSPLKTLFFLNQPNHEFINLVQYSKSSFLYISLSLSLSLSPSTPSLCVCEQTRVVISKRIFLLSPTLWSTSDGHLPPLLSNPSLSAVAMRYTRRHNFLSFKRLKFTQN